MWGITPARETRPYVAFSPTTPESPAGIRIEPPVSEPMAMKQRPAATAAPDPPDDRPGFRRTSHGFRTGGKSTPQAASLMVVLPSKTAPASCKRTHTVASCAGIRSANTPDPLRVATPVVS